MEAEISAFTRGSAAVRYRGVTLKRKEARKKRGDAQKSSFLTLKLTSPSGGQNGVEMTSLHLPPSFTHRKRERERVQLGEEGLTPHLFFLLFFSFFFSIL